MDVNKEALLRDIRQVVAQTQALMDAGGDRLGKARDAMAEHLEAATDALADLERGARRTMRRANHYAQDNPWQVAGAALLVGLVLGAALGIGASRQRD